MFRFVSALLFQKCFFPLFLAPFFQACGATLFQACSASFFQACSTPFFQACSTSFFQADLIGFSVFDTRVGAVIGTLAEILSLPAGDIYRVQGKNGDILIPARPEFTRGIDPDTRTLTVETIPGLE